MENDDSRSYRCSRGFVADEPWPILIPPSHNHPRIVRGAILPTYRPSDHQTAYIAVPVSQPAPRAMRLSLPSRPPVTTPPAHASSSMSAASGSSFWSCNRNASADSSITHDSGFNMQSSSGSLRRAPRQHSGHSARLTRTESTTRNGGLLACGGLSTSPEEYNTPKEHTSLEESADGPVVAGLLDRMATNEILARVTSRLEDVQKDKAEENDAATLCSENSQEEFTTPPKKDQNRKAGPERARDGLHIKTSEELKSQRTASGRSRPLSPHPDHRMTVMKSFRATLQRYDDACADWLVSKGMKCPFELGATRLARRSLDRSGRFVVGEEQLHEEARRRCPLKKLAGGKSCKASQKSKMQWVGNLFKNRTPRSPQGKLIEEELRMEDEKLKSAKHAVTQRWQISAPLSHEQEMELYRKQQENQKATLGSRVTVSRLKNVYL